MGEIVIIDSIRIHRWRGPTGLLPDLVGDRAEAGFWENVVTTSLDSPRWASGENGWEIILFQFEIARIYLNFKFKINVFPQRIFIKKKKDLLFSCGILATNVAIDAWS